ncbi:cell envelope integrity protein TolA [Thalassotalea nanhaiensis]|uniref:Cell envelope integrity protein TolA n=1 Tax=Thalassotalea nanhaiensis TaxID=3065648 RepID=A0ABY9TGT7_9GAMM|nr:cell envelope integrity protein TolA [Colwelliaceae bacterium SQ345]
MFAVFKNAIGNLVNKCMLIFTYLPDGKNVKQQYIIAISAAVGIHLVMGIVLMLNTDFSPKAKPIPKPQMQVIDAVVIDESKLKQQVDKLKKQKQAAKKREDDRIKELERRADDAAKKRKQEAQKIKDLEKQRKKKEAEKKKADAAAKTARAKAASEEKQRKKKEQERKQAEKAASDAKAKRLREEKAEKEAAEKRRRKKLEDDKRKKEAAERAEQERLLEQQMLEEMASRDSARSQQVMTEAEKYGELMKQAIKRNFIDDPSYKGKSCKLKITLAASGFVINVQSGTGDPYVCKEAVKAVNKTGTLPVSKDPEVFEKLRNISLTYNSEYQ